MGPADVGAFRAAMGAFPTGVTVVTVACGDGDMRGMAVNAFSSVSLDPTLVLVCLDATSRGDHLIVLGEVVALVHRPQLDPLIFHAGAYTGVRPDAGAPFRGGHAVWPPLTCSGHG